VSNISYGERARRGWATGQDMLEQDRTICTQPELANEANNNAAVRRNDKAGERALIRQKGRIAYSLPEALYCRFFPASPVYLDRRIYIGRGSRIKSWDLRRDHQAESRKTERMVQQQRGRREGRDNDVHSLVCFLVPGW
jgi:hypothetical protein